MFLDFFAIGTQRSALNVAANVSRACSPDTFDMIVDTIPILTNLIQYSDSKLVEKAVICFTRLADCFHGTDKVEQLAKHGLLQNLLRLTSNSGMIR